MLISIIDTETTGIPRSDFKSPDMPHLASITIIIYDTEAARIQASFNTLIQPDGWEMPPEAGGVNGLDTETLEQFGIPLEHALQVIADLLSPSELLVAHNTPFDVKILASAFYRADKLDSLDELLTMETYCTMRESKHIVQAKNVKGNLKMPRLTEAYEFFFEEQLDNAHSANADTVGCLEVYLAIQEYNAKAESIEEGEVSL